MIRRPFQPQFELLILNGQKIHTVRPVPKRMPQIGEEFVGYVWTGKPYRSPQREIFRSTVSMVLFVELACNDGWLWIDGKRITEIESANYFAWGDGFKDFREMLEWFRDHHGLPFTGIIIHWRKLL